MTIEIARATDPTLAESYAARGHWRAQRLRDGLEHWAGQTPGRTALIDNERSWTYAELEAVVARMVAGLRQHGAGSGSAVLLVAPVAAPAVAAYLATVRSGAAVVMLDRRCGTADVEHATGPLDVDLVVSTSEHADRLDLQGLGVPVLDLDHLGDGHQPDRAWAEPDPAAPAAVFFTSGTTSRPKAVVHSLDTLRSGARHMAHGLGLGPDDAAFLSSPVASITGVMQVHLTLDRGAALVLEDRFSAASSLRRLVEHGATTLGGAPVIAEELFAEARRQDLPTLPLRSISLGGAMIPRDLLELATGRWGIVPTRVYGSSEAPLSTYTMPDDTGERRLADDGAVAPGAEVATDPATGEVLLRGPHLFLGYLHDEDNRAAFTDDGWFRTGDLGRLDGDRLTVTGRLKEVVVRKGLKISLPEVDAVARTLPGVVEAVGYAVPDPATGERLALALHGADLDGLAFESVVDHLLAAGLAKWKLPEEVVVWDAPLPRTTSGKVQRRRLDGGGVRRLLAPRLRS